MSKLLALILILITVPCAATTYYVRTDGGTSTQCTGTTDAAYPGTGSGQACAFIHPAWALGGYGGASGVMVAGDTLIIGAGEYMAGLGMPNSGGSYWNSYEPYLNAVPAGSSAVAKTKIYGAGYNTGCTGTKPQLWGTGGTLAVLTLGSNTEIQCLDITDHSACIGSGPIDGTVDGFPTQCVAGWYTGSASGNWARHGVDISNGASGVTLTNVDIHGLGGHGIYETNSGGDLNFTDVKIMNNGFAGWDTPLTNTRTGEHYLTRTRIEWNGCGERYPLQAALGASSNAHHCWEQQQGGYGDGFGGGDGNPGNWTITDSSFSWNSSDGLDLAHGNGNSTVKFIRSKAEGNNGQGFKSTGTFYMENSIIAGNCNFFHGAAFTSLKDNTGASVEMNYCRAAGTPISINFPLTSNRGYITNSTIMSIGDVVFSLAGAGCTGSPQLTIRNSIIYGGYDWGYEHNVGSADELTALYWYEGTCTAAAFDFDYSIVYLTASSNSGCEGANSLCGSDPLFFGTIKQGPGIASGYYTGTDYAAQLYLQSGSPARDAAYESATLIGTSNDFNNYSRGGSWDIGALEYGSYPASDSTPPTMSAPLPSGTVAFVSDPQTVTLQITTDEACLGLYGCRYSAVGPNITYSSMTSFFETTNGLDHSKEISLSPGNYTYWVHCADTAGNATTTPAQISFDISAEVPSQVTFRGGVLKGGKLK